MVLSFGAGVNTFALLALAAKGELDVDYVLFADTGAEWPETYRVIEEIAKPVTEELGAEFVHLRPTVEGTTDLWSWCFKHRIIPLREYRTCTAKWKIRPIRAWIKKNLGYEKTTVIIGFSAEEKHRAEKREGPTKASFPLLEGGIDRAGCEKIITDSGWPSIPKSGCYFCPFARVGQWRRLFYQHPELYAKAEELEKHQRDYPGAASQLTYRPLEKMRARMDDNSIQQALEGFDAHGCGVCFR